MPERISPAAVVPRLHLVTDDGVLTHRRFREIAEALVAAGGPRVALHVRGPHTGGRILHALTSALVPAAHASGAWLVVNDRVDVALTAGVERVHLGRRSLSPGEARRILGSGARVGASTHDGAEVAAAVDEGADWIFVGTIFPTPSHPDQSGSGASGVRVAVGAASSVPVLAIGGVTPERVRDVRSAGAHGVAVVRGVWSAPDPVRALESYLEALEALEA